MNIIELITRIDNATEELNSYSKWRNIEAFDKDWLVVYHNNNSTISVFEYVYGNSFNDDCPTIVYDLDLNVLKYSGSLIDYVEVITEKLKENLNAEV